MNLKAGIGFVGVLFFVLRSLRVDMYGVCGRLAGKGCFTWASGIGGFGRNRKFRILM